MVRGSWFVIRGLGFVAKDAMEIAADSDCRRLPRKRGRQSVIGRGLGNFRQGLQNYQDFGENL